MRDQSQEPKTNLDQVVDQGSDHPEPSPKEKRQIARQNQAIKLGKTKQPNFFVRHKIPVIIVAVIILLAGAGAAAYFLWLKPMWESHPDEQTNPTAESEPEPVRYYSKLSGEEITDNSLNDLPIYCMQIPNGMDGARPQVGLAAAPIVFEAIAEAGITRFAAIFQGYNSSMIGPIRSLRMYYLEWDTPFDCTVVHAGGADDALRALKVGGYRDLTENYTYMWRNTSNYRAPNNLFTSSALLNKFNADRGYNTSNFTAPTRLTPDQAEEARIKAVKAAEPKTVKDENGNETTTPGTPLVTEISLKFGNDMRNFDLKYTYDAPTNSYKRFYDSGAPHTAYLCPDGLSAKPNPARECGDVRQLNPSVVIALMVPQTIASDRYHQDITTTGTGKAYIFQNGTATEATWSKPDKTTQLKFTDANGEEVALVPGQAWITALPNNRGQVSY